VKHDDLLGQIRDAIDVDPAAPFSETTELKSLSNWDSLSMIGVLSMLDFEYRIVVSADTLRSCVTVADIVALVEKAPSP
jgi:acyl carrier protein